MDEVDNPNFEELCRVCATKTIGLATNIFKNEGTTRQISKKICTCLPIQVDEMDELPKIICENCLYKLESFYDFRESSAQAERLLVEIHKKLNSTQAQKDQQQPSVVPIDHNELIVVQTCQLLNDEHNILLTHHSGDNSDSPDSIDLNNHDLITHVFSNQSFKTGETIFVDSNIHSMCDPQFTEDNLNLMKQHQLSEPFRFQCVNVRDENSGNDIGPLVSNEFQIKCNQQQYDLNDIMEYAEKEIRGNISPTVDSQLNKVQLHNDFNKEINPEMDAFKYEDNNSDHSLFVDEQFYNASVPNLLTDQQVNGFKIEKVESLAYLSSTKDSVCDNISGGSCEQNSEFEAHHDTYKCTICLAVFTDEDVLNSHKKETHASVDNPKADPILEESDKQVTSDRVQKYFLENLGEYKEDGEKQIHTKLRDFCIFCKSYVLNFARHILRKHSIEKEVQKIISLSPKNKSRRRLFSELKKRGNFFIRKPMRRLRTGVNILPCTNCMGYYSAKRLWHHRKACMGKSDKLHQVKAQDLLLKDLRVDKQLKDKVFLRMRPDVISMKAKTDELICEFGARYFKGHREKYSVNVTSRKMRELARLLIEIQKLKPSVKNLYEALRPEHFEILISATKIVAQYNEKNESFKSASTALNLGTAIKQCCRIAIVFVHKKKQVDSTFSVVEPEADLKTLIQLIDREWSLKISTRAINDLNMKKWTKVTMVPLLDDLKIIKECLILKATTAVNQLQINCEDKNAYVTLLETVFCRVLLLNRRQPRELQRLHLDMYEQSEEDSKNYEEFSDIITTSEKILLQRFKRVFIRSKKGHRVPILFSLDIQEHIDILLRYRENFVNKNNVYLFGNPSSIQPICGYEIINKYAKLSGAKNPQAILAISEYDMEQLSTFIDSSIIVQRGSYYLPDDIFQTAKILMLLLLMEKHEATQYKDKNLDKVNIDLDIDHHDVNDNGGVEFQPLSKTSKVISIHSLPGTSQADSMPQLPLNASCFLSRPRQSRILVPWTDEQKETVRQFFATHIKKHMPPKKHECVILKNKYTTLLENKNWLKIKVFVQNEYTKRKRWKNN